MVGGYRVIHECDRPNLRPLSLQNKLGNVRIAFSWRVRQNLTVDLCDGANDVRVVWGQRPLTPVS
jgi:hypothetical protein